MCRPCIHKPSKYGPQNGSIFRALVAGSCHDYNMKANNKYPQKSKSNISFSAAVEVNMEYYVPGLNPDE